MVFHLGVISASFEVSYVVQASLRAWIAGLFASVVRG